MLNKLLYIVVLILFFSCGQHISKKAEDQNSLNEAHVVSDTSTLGDDVEPTRRIAFNTIAEITADTSSSIWVKKQDNTFSLALHFQYKDTLAVSYSPECWLTFPYKLEQDKIVVYWDNNIDTKYDFDIVKAINKSNKKYIGKPFMTLELVNDTICNATYLLEELVRDINSASKKRTFFPDKFTVIQDGEMYD